MFAAAHLPYKQTGFFSNIVLDYLEGEERLRPFYSFTPTVAEIAKAIQQKKQQPLDRQLLVKVLKQQYKNVSSDVANNNIDLLLQENTFTICTAHQPNLFTGPLYFIYKILHTIKLAAHLKAELPANNFVPVFYLGCEDADLEELNNFTVQGKKYVWNTKQKGAVGRMKIDKELTIVVEELQQQISVDSHGEEWIAILKKYFTVGKDIQTATFELVNHLFGAYGLVVLIPDNADLKRVMIPVFEEDLFQNRPSKIVQQASQQLAAHYQVQAYARPINLFYLKDDVRERIELRNGRFEVRNSNLFFSEAELKIELQEHPERFSPNVILRGLYQESILPNAAFIGGGGELAYWLQLKELFQQYKVPFPVQVLRNSFLIIGKTNLELFKKLGLAWEDLFLNEQDVLNKLIEQKGKKPRLNGEMDNLHAVYRQLKELASAYDTTLGDHVEALKAKTMNQLLALENKMLRAERKKHEATQRQIAKLKRRLFPNGNLQERVENIAGFYAEWGSEFIGQLYDHSPALQQQFTVLHQTR